MFDVLSCFCKNREMVKKSWCLGLIPASTPQRGLRRGIRLRPTCGCGPDRDAGPRGTRDPARTVGRHRPADVWAPQAGVDAEPSSAFYELGRGENREEIGFRKRQTQVINHRRSFLEQNQFDPGSQPGRAGGAPLRSRRGAVREDSGGRSSNIVSCV